MAQRWGWSILANLYLMLYVIGLFVATINGLDSAGWALLLVLSQFVELPMSELPTTGMDFARTMAVCLIAVVLSRQFKKAGDACAERTATRSTDKKQPVSSTAA